MPFEATVELLIHIFISLAMLCIGMSASLKDMGLFILERERLLRVLAANVFIPPIIAVLIIAIFPIPRASGVVLFLLAFAPGGINAVQFSTKAPGQTTAAGALLFLLSLIGLVLVPAAAQVLLPVDVLERFAWDQLALRVFGVVGVPLVAGVLMRVYLPDVAEQIYKPVMLISTASFIASVMMSLSIRQEAASELGFATILAMLVFIVSLLAVGWFLGGGDPDFNQVLAICTNLRNVGLVYLLVDECCFNPLYSISILAFMALMVPVNLVFTILCAVMRKRREKLQHQGRNANE